MKGTISNGKYSKTQIKTKGKNQSIQLTQNKKKKEGQIL
jgi:hypothetical protein